MTASAGLRYDQYKAVFMEQPAHGLEVWIKPLIPLRAPKPFNLRSDPFERAEQKAGDYVKWAPHLVFPAQNGYALDRATVRPEKDRPPDRGDAVRGDHD